MLQTGDIILYKPETFVGDLICKMTKSPYSHVALVLEGSQILNANRFIKSNVIELEYNEDIHHIYRPKNIKEIHKESIIQRSYKYIGKRYDYLQIIGLFLRVTFNWNIHSLNSLNKFICSEVIDKIYYESGVQRLDDKLLFNITPFELLDKYEFVKVI